MLLGRFFRVSEVCVVKEPSEQQQVTEVHGRGQCDVGLRHPARVRATGLQVTVRDVVYEAADEHLRQLTERDEH